MSERLTEAQLRLLATLSRVGEQHSFGVTGHQIATGFALVRRGLAQHDGYIDHGLRVLFHITPAGLAEHKRRAALTSPA